MIEEAELLKKGLDELAKLLKMQERNLNKRLKDIPKDQRAKFRKIIADAKNGKMNFSDIQNIKDGNYNKS
ncbi:MAG: hypothetical protein IIC76_15535 [Bacteroidetes bacterium]|nr:hypothetical protein [Bacteroidota bacterium]